MAPRINLLGGFAGSAIFVATARRVLGDGGSEAAAKELADTMRELLLNEGQGHKWPSLPNVSSAAGDPPAYQEGTLQGDISHWQEGRSWRAGISADKDSATYAQVLEYGNAHIAPRPYLRIAAERSGIKVLRAAAKQMVKDLLALQLGGTVGGLTRKIRIGSPE